MSTGAASGAGSDEGASANGPQLLCLSLNQDQTCLACGLDSGFVIYDIEPFQQRCFRKDVPVQGQLLPMGPLRIVTMLFRSNIFALVGTAANQSFPPNKVAIWDDMENGGKTIGVVTCSSEVKNVLLRRDKVLPGLQRNQIVRDVPSGCGRAPRSCVHLQFHGLETCSSN
jgi:hypothetical protein